MNPPQPTLIFDGDCSFCRMWIERWKLITGDSIRYAPYQEVSEDFPEIPLESFRKAVKLVEPDGRITSGAEAVYRSLSRVAEKRWLLWQYEHNPLFRAISDFSYRVIASHRNFFYTLTRLFWGKHVLPSAYSLSYWLFFRLLAVVFFIAFASLSVQVSGLLGSRGVLPARQLMEVASATYGSSGVWKFPTLCWLSSSDFFLKLLCGGGMMLSVMLLIGLCPVLVLFLLWTFYLSLVVAGQDFLSFQWDVLLLETAFIAMFLAPRGWFTWKRSHANPSSGFSFLRTWLLFRLMFSSGASKLLSGDQTWRDLTAMRYHYETQPLPTTVGWYAYHLPGWFQNTTTFLVLAVELIAPVLILLPRRMRIIGFYSLVIFQILIAFTGNYAFFNILTIALCLPLLPDEKWPGAAARRLRNYITSAAPGKSRRAFSKAIFLVLLLLSGFQFTLTLGGAKFLPQAAFEVLDIVEPLRTVNRYGLFSVMTTERPEIIMEGSEDGVSWSAYSFRYKPGDLEERPLAVAPHQPRLDWQMWFAALSSYRSNDWFISFCQRLLEGSPDVLDLLEKNPFPAHPPTYVRAIVYRYHFTSMEEKSRTGRWWKRENEEEYSPVFSLRRPASD